MSSYNKADLDKLEKRIGFIRDNLEKVILLERYLPDLIFEDVAIIERIREHPMAIWKTRNKSY